MNNEAQQNNVLSFSHEKDKINLRKSEEKLVSSDVIFDNNMKWMTTEEAARYVRVSVAQMRNLVHQGRVRFYRLGARLRFLRSDLDRMLKPSGKS